MKTKSLLLGALALGMLSVSNLKAQCTAGFASAENGGTVTFTNTSVGTSNVVYAWDFGDGAYAHTANASHTYFANGTYIVCLNMSDTTNSAPCQAQECDTIVVTGASGQCDLAVTLQGSNPTSDTLANGAVLAIVSGGVPTYSYAWSNGKQESTINNMSAVTDLAAGCYDVVVTDMNGCTATASTCLVVNTPNFPQCNLTVKVLGTKPSAQGATDGSVVSTVTGGQGDLTYTWSNGETGTSISGVGAGCYSLIVRDTAGCAAGDAVCLIDITLPSVPCSTSIHFQKSPIDSSSYFGWAIPYGVPPFTYMWNFGDGTISTDMFPNHVYSQSGSYLVCVTVTDAVGCVATSCDSAQRLMPNVLTAKSITILASSASTLTGVAQYTTLKSSIFPNPAFESFTVQLQETSQATRFVMHNQVGEVVMDQNMTAITNRVDVSKFPAGIYWLKLSAGDQSAVHKLVLVK